MKSQERRDRVEGSGMGLLRRGRGEVAVVAKSKEGSHYRPASFEAGSSDSASYCDLVVAGRAAARVGDPWCCGRFWLI